MGYQDFVLKIEPDGEGGFSAVVLESPAGGGSGSLELPEPAEAIEKRYRDGLAARWGSAVQPLGEVLFRSLFHGAVYGLLERSLGQVENARRDDPGAGLRIRLVMDLEKPALAAVAALPWELLYWPERREFLGLARTISLVRSVLVPRAGQPPLGYPLRGLVVASDPTEAPLDFTAELAALRSIEGVELEILEQPSVDTLRDRLAHGDFHVFHFLGHGRFRDGAGALDLYDPQEGTLPLAGTALADLLRGTSVRLTFLNACHSSRAAFAQGEDPFRGVAAALAMAGLPAVIAMQGVIHDPAAGLFTKTLYQRLAAEDPIDRAVAEARLAVRAPETISMEWATPVLFLHRSADGPVEGASSRTGIRRHILDRSRLIRDKTEDFAGRKWVFERIETFAHQHPQGGFFTLIGEPGIGKSTLIARMTQRYRSVHHFNIEAEGRNTPDFFLANLCAQLIERFSLGIAALPPEATRNGGLLKDLIERISRQLDPGEKVFLLVDALDEAATAGLPASVNPLYLPASLPAGFFLVVSTRPGAPHVRFEGPREELTIEQGSPFNRADICEYLEGRLRRPGIQAYLSGRKLDGGAFVSEMAERSQGNFMYLCYVLPEIEGGFYKTRDLSTLPKGLEGYYEDHWERMKRQGGADWIERQLPVLAALTAVRDPLPFDLIVEFSDLKDRRRVRATLNEWKQFIYSSPSTGETFPAGEPLYRLYHQSFRDFICRKDEIADEKVRLGDVNQRITDFMLRQFDDQP